MWLIRAEYKFALISLPDMTFMSQRVSFILLIESEFTWAETEVKDSDIILIWDTFLFFKMVYFYVQFQSL